MSQDPVDAIRRQWRHADPELDTRPMEIAGRVLLAAALLEARIAPLLRRHGLSIGGFDVLATLRRHGPPFALTPTALHRELLITSGTMTHRLDGLEASGLIERTANPADRRGVLVQLTPTGRRRVDLVIRKHLRHEAELFRSVSPADSRTLCRILSGLIERLEDQ